MSTHTRMDSGFNYLDAAGLASHLPGITKKWIQQKTREGIIPAIRVGRKCFYNLEAVENALRAMQS